MNKCFGGITYRFNFQMITVESSWVKQFQNSINYDGSMSRQKSPYFRWL